MPLFDPNRVPAAVQGPVPLNGFALPFLHRKAKSFGFRLCSRNSPAMFRVLCAVLLPQSCTYFGRRIVDSQSTSTFWYPRNCALAIPVAHGRSRFVWENRLQHCPPSWLLVLRAFLAADFGEVPLGRTVSHHLVEFHAGTVRGHSKTSERQRRREEWEAEGENCCACMCACVCVCMLPVRFWMLVCAWMDWGSQLDVCMCGMCVWAGHEMSGEACHAFAVSLNSGTAAWSMLPGGRALGGWICAGRHVWGFLKSFRRKLRKHKTPEPEGNGPGPAARAVHPQSQSKVQLRVYLYTQNSLKP